MHVLTELPVRLVRVVFSAAICVGALAGCDDAQPLGSRDRAVVRAPMRVIQALDCTASRTEVSCSPAASRAGAASQSIIGGQNVYVKLTSTNVSYDSITEIFQFDVTVKNLLNEAMGTPDGIVADPQGIRAFFHTGPTATSGFGDVYVYNPDGYDAFTASNQPYFTYSEILPKNAVSASRTWQIFCDNTVGNFAFTVYVETDLQYLLVINEVLANPGGTISDAAGEWFEVYNAGTFPVNLQSLVIADSSAAGRQPYHTIASSIAVPSGTYRVLGITTDTVANGGVDVDYAYGSALALANSMDALKISRVYGTDTLTLDRAVYTSAAISAQNGISRELINPTLNNASIDGGNWADASITAVYGAGGRGTPGAQNSAYVP